MNPTRQDMIKQLEALLFTYGHCLTWNERVFIEGIIQREKNGTL